jgi:hypothetical protein
MIKLIKNPLLLVVLMLCEVSHADTGASKDWTWNTDEEHFYSAITKNSEGQILGQYCYLGEGTCFYIVGLDIYCEPGSAYPALVNSDKGADHIVLKCVHGFEGRNILAIYDFEKIDELVRVASHLGIVLAMDNDQFMVIRFSLLGSSVAIERMRNAARAAIDDDASPRSARLPNKEIM